MPTVQPRSLILDVYAAFVRRMDGWLAIADLVTLMDDLGQDEQSVRSAISRMKKAGLLRAESRGGVAGYALTEQAATILTDGDQRIFNSNQPADLNEGWVIAVFSVPERERHLRHRLRSRLVWLGFGQVASGVWIAPRRMLPEARRLLERTGLAQYVTLFEGDYVGFDDLAGLISRTWDLHGLESLYASFIERYEPALEEWQFAQDPNRQAFVQLTFALSEWRRLPYMDPGLPSEFLLADWVGVRARDLFQQLVDRLEYPALAYVAQVVRQRKDLTRVGATSRSRT
jgi:phenylacetic acid degradation operon negative regulatory protein